MKMIIQLTNFDPEFPVYLIAEKIICFQRAPASRQTQVVMDLVTSQGPMAFFVMEDPQAIMSLLQSRLH